MIALGCDHAGVELKNEIIKMLEAKGYEWKDYGCYTTESVDYPDYAHAVAHAVADGEAVGFAAVSFLMVFELSLMEYTLSESAGFA